VNIHPTALSLQPDHALVIQWSNGQRRRYEPSQLRLQCPCATCISEHEKTTDSSPPSAVVPVTISQMHPLGNYAYNIQFSDGHGTGIFTLELLLKLGKEEVMGEE